MSAPSLSVALRGFGRTLLYRTPAHRLGAWLRRARGAEAAHRTQAWWDAQLAGPRARYLGGTASIDLRNAATVQVLRHALPRLGSLLDVACAGGALARPARDAGCARYVGLDISRVAIDAADRSLGEFHVADLCAFEPRETFDAIVFNEVLYYLDVDEAVAQLERYARRLAGDGVLLVSLKDDAKSRAILARAERAFEWVAGVLFQERVDGPGYAIRSDAQRPAYLVGALRPRGTGAISAIG